MATHSMEFAFLPQLLSMLLVLFFSIWPKPAKKPLLGSTSLEICTFSCGGCLFFCTLSISRGQKPRSPLGACKDFAKCTMIKKTSVLNACKTSPARTPSLIVRVVLTPAKYQQGRFFNLSLAEWQSIAIVLANLSGYCLGRISSHRLQRASQASAMSPLQSPDLERAKRCMFLGKVPVR